MNLSRLYRIIQMDGFVLRTKLWAQIERDTECMHIVLNNIQLSKKSNVMRPTCTHQNAGQKKSISQRDMTKQINPIS